MSTPPGPAGAAVAAVARLRAASPAAADLAVLLSTAIRIEPALVRQMRLLLPHADVGAEADLWTSELLASASPVALSFRPEVAEVLQAELAGPGYGPLRDAACDVVATLHADDHWSLRLEEKINRLLVQDEPDGPERVEQLLLAATACLRTGDAPGTDPVSTARWLLGALARMPRAAARTEAGVIARLSAGTRLDGRLDLDERPAIAGAWMPWLLGVAGIRPRPVPVRFTAAGLIVNAAAEDAVFIEVPDTDPMVLEAHWHDTVRTHHRRVRFRRDEQVPLELRVDSVELEALTGDKFRLTRPGGVALGSATRGIDFSAARAALRPCLGREREIEEILEYLRQPSWVVITGLPGIGKSVLLGAVLDRLRRDGEPVAQHFYGHRATWDRPDRVDASLDAQLAGAASRGTVALDGVSGVPEGLPWADRHDVAVLLTCRDGYLINRRDTVVVRLDPMNSGEVCQAMLSERLDELRLVLGGTQAARAAFARLVDRAGSVPGRLAAIVDWLVSQPVGAAGLDTIPVSLTARIDDVLDRYADPATRRGLAAVVVAQPGFTGVDARLVTGDDAVLRAMGHDGLARRDGDEWTLTHPSVRDAFVERFGADGIRDGHAAHAGAFPHRDPAAATPYQIAAAVVHHIGAIGSVEESLAVNAAFLDRRQRQDGVGAVLADLDLLGSVGGDGNPTFTGGSRENARTVARAVRVVAPALAAEPGRFTDLVANALYQLGAADLADAMVADGWPPALRVRVVYDLDALAPAWKHTGPNSVAAVVGSRGLAVASAWGVLGEGSFPETSLGPVTLSGPAAAADWDGSLAVADGPAVYIAGSASGPPSRLPAEAVLPCPVTSLGAGQGLLVAGLDDGRVAVLSRRADGSIATRVMLGHAARAGAVAVTGAGLVSAGDDGTVRVWNPATGVCRRVYSRHHAAVRHLVVLGGGAVVTGDAKGGLRWWDPATGADLGVLSGHEAAVTAVVPVAAEPGTEVVVTAGADGALYRWELRGRTVGGTPLQAAGGPAIEHAVWCDGSLTTTGSSGRLTAWDAAGARGLDVRPGGVEPPVHGLAWSPADGCVVVLHAGGAAAFPVRDWPPPAGPVALGALALSAGGRRVAYGTARGAGSLSLDNGQLWIPYAMSESPPRAVGLIREPGPAGEDTLAVVWQDGRLLHQNEEWPGDDKELLAVERPDRRRFWVYDRDGRLDRWEPRAGGAAMWIPKDTRALAVTVARAGKSPGIVAAGAGVTVMRSDGAFIAAGTPPVEAIAFDQGATTVYAGTSDGVLWRVPVDGPDAAPAGGHTGAVTGVAVGGRTEQGVLTTSADGTIRLWDHGHRGLLGVVAGPTPFLAVDAVHDTAVARDADGRLWVLELDVPHHDPVPPALEVSLGGDEDNEIELRGPGTMRVRLRFDVVPPVPVELRAVRIILPLQPRQFDIAPNHLEIRRPPGGPTDPVTEDGRLVIPRRLAAGNTASIRAAVSVYNMRIPPGVPVAALRLTLYDPVRDEWQLDVGAVFEPRGESAFKPATGARVFRPGQLDEPWNDDESEA
ncbi:AAA family ATPase [Actinoplanes sp. NPDC048796]|uniref:WD40 repeat domain-containing protein n=1 Tax=Actinoplanes sp. NPDC048796 TaxID=3155640 RepID=UPI003406260C